MDLKDVIRQSFRGEIYDDPKTLTKYSHDASIFALQPKIVVCPKDSEDIKYLVGFVQLPGNHHLSLTARSAGTDMSGGAISEGIIMDFTKHFNKILKITPDYALAQPGVFYRDFEKQTKKNNTLMPSYPASKDIAALGGIVANNAGGEKTLTYGKTQKYISELSVILADGNEYSFSPLSKSELDKKMSQQNFEGKVYRKIYALLDKNYSLIQNARPNVSKNSSGYYLWDVWDKKTFDLTQLFCGSQGTLGIITQIKFDLVKIRPESSLLVIMLNDLHLLPGIVSGVLKHSPESFECFDDKTLRVAIKYPMHFLTLIWHLPKPLPKLTLLAQFSGDSKAKTLRLAQLAQHDLEEFGVHSRIAKSRKEENSYWAIRRESFNLLRLHAKNESASPFIDDIIVKPEHLTEFLPKLDAILKPYSDKLTYTLAGHIGDGNFHIIPLMKLSSKDSARIIEEVSEKVFKLVFSYNGSMSGEHNDGLIRTPFLKEMYGNKVYSLFEQVKEIFDPNNIFNPGKKVGGNLDYAMEHLKKD